MELLQTLEKGCVTSLMSMRASRDSLQCQNRDKFPQMCYYPSESITRVGI